MTKPRNDPELLHQKRLRRRRRLANSFFSFFSFFFFFFPVMARVAEGRSLHVALVKRTPKGDAGRPYHIRQGAPSSRTHLTEPDSRACMEGLTSLYSDANKMPCGQGGAVSASDLSLDERKFEQETKDKKRELDLKERELAATEKDSSRSRWSSPLVLGLFAAALGLAGNIWIEHANNKWKKDSERLQAQSTLILEAIKTGSTDKACKNLLFFVDLNLLDDTNKSIRQSCTKDSNTAPSLPSPISSSSSGLITRSQLPVSYTVEDAETGNRVSKAEIKTFDGIVIDTTDDHGKFLVLIELASYLRNLTIEKDGYIPLEISSLGGVSKTFKIHKSR